MIILSLAALAILVAVVAVQHFKLRNLKKDLEISDSTLDDLLESFEIESADNEAIVTSLQNYISTLQAEINESKFELQSLKEVIIKTPETKAPKAPKTKQAAAPVAPAKKKKSAKKSS